MDNLRRALAGDINWEDALKMTAAAAASAAATTPLRATNPLEAVVDGERVLRSHLRQARVMLRWRHAEMLLLVPEDSGSQCLVNDGELAFLYPTRKRLPATYLFVWCLPLVYGEDMLVSLALFPVTEDREVENGIYATHTPQGLFQRVGIIRADAMEPSLYIAGP